MKVVVYKNEIGRRIGQSHPNAKYADHEIAMIHDLRDQDLSYAKIADKLEMPRATVASICQGRRRSQTIAFIGVETK